MPEGELKEIKELLEKNLEFSKAIYEASEKTRRYIFWGRIFEAVKFIIILVPIIIGVVYLPPLFRGLFSFYQGFLGGSSNALGDIGGNASEIMDLFK